MSFFKDFKDDLSIAVSELLPGGGLDMEDDSDMMVNTLEDELDIESELSKLDGLLEDVDKTDRTRQPDMKVIKLDEPVLESPVLQQAKKPEKQGAALRMEPEEKELFSAMQAGQPDIEAAGAEMKKEAADDIQFSFEERMENAADAALQIQPVAVSVSEDVLPDNDNVKTSSIIKEEIPMNEEMASEAVSMKEEYEAASEVTDEVSIITAGTAIKGNLSTTGSLKINGRVDGNVQCNGKLEVTGTIKGNSASSEVFSDAAKIEGEISSTGTVKIGLGSIVVGNITATSAVIAGAVKGDIDVQGPVVVDTSAVIVGNIKSRSVQINNGAVIEGFCSQCYADIDMDSLFGDNKKGK